MEHPSSSSSSPPFPPQYPTPTIIFHTPSSYPTAIPPTQIFPNSIAPMRNCLYTLPGIKFRPTDHHLISYYLHNKVFGLPFFCHPIIDCDLYGSQEPWEIWKFYKGLSKDNEDLYFFTALKKKFSKGKQICRRVGSGSWQGEDSAEQIQTDDTVIGSKKRYRYEKKESEHDGEWIMQEYKLVGHDEYVLCRIRKNDRPAKKRDLEKKRKSPEVEHFDDNVPSNKCFKVQNYEEQVESEAMALVIDGDVIEDVATNSAFIEALFPGLSTDNECVDLGDLFLDEEQVQSSFQTVDDGSGTKTENAINSSVGEDPPNDDIVPSNKCFKVQNYQEQVESEAMALVNDGDVIEDVATNSAFIEALFPGLSTDYECVDLGDLFLDEEQAHSSFQTVDDGSGTKTENAINSGLGEDSPSNGSGEDLKNDEFYKELFPEDEEQVQSSFQTIVDDDSATKIETATNSSADEEPPSNGSEDDLKTFFDGLDDNEYYKVLFPEDEEEVLLDSMSLADIGHLMSSLPLEIVQSF